MTKKNSIENQPNLFSKIQVAQPEEAVYTTAIHTGVFTNTRLVAEAFGRQHKDVLKIMNRLIKNGAIDGRTFALNSYTTKNNRTAKMYELDRKAFIVLALSFTGADADRLKGKFVDLFLSQEEELKSWRSARKTLKSNHIEFTDKIKPLGDLLKAEGSKQHFRVYSTIQLQINKAVTGKSTPRGADIGEYRGKLSEGEIEDIKKIEDVVFLIIDHLIGLSYTGRQVRESVKNFLHSDMPAVFMKAAV